MQFNAYFVCMLFLAHFIYNALHVPLKRAFVPERFSYYFRQAIDSGQNLELALFYFLNDKRINY